MRAEGQSLGLSSATQLPFLGVWTRLWKAAFETLLSLGKDWTFTVLAAPTAVLMEGTASSLGLRPSL